MICFVFWTLKKFCITVLHGDQLFFDTWGVTTGSKCTLWKCAADTEQVKCFQRKTNSFESGVAAAVYDSWTHFCGLLRTSSLRIFLIDILLNESAACCVLLFFFFYLCSCSCFDYRHVFSCRNLSYQLLCFFVFFLLFIWDSLKHIFFKTLKFIFMNTIKLDFSLLNVIILSFFKLFLIKQDAPTQKMLGRVLFL